MNKFLMILAAIFSFRYAQGAIVETATLSECFAIASADSSKARPSKVLYVFDIDNTVLELNENFGSVQWFRWQRQLITDNIETDRIAPTIDELLEKQGFIYNISRAQTPETQTALLLKILQGEHPVMYHTSRSLDVRDATERELRRNNLLPLTYNLGGSYGSELVFGEESRPVSYRHGVYMSAGQDKGVFLNHLLKSLTFSPEHIVFVDDEKKNLDNVDREFADKIPTTLCRYSKVDERVNAFVKSNKAAEKRLWKDFSNLVDKL